MSETVTPKNIAASALLTNVMSSMNLASIGSDIVTMAQDTAESQNQINQLLDETNKMLAQAQAFDIWGNKNGEDIIKNALKSAPQTMNTIYQWQRLAGLAKRGNLSVSANIFQQRINNIAAKEHVECWLSIVNDIPEAYVKQQATKWYNKAFGIEDPQDRDFYMLMINGFKTPTDYVTKFREDMGFSYLDAQNIVNMRYWQYGVPGLKDAWTLVQRGLWQRSDWQKLATLGLGFTADDADAMFQLFNYVPSIGDVMSLSTLIPLDNVWVNQAFDRTGMSASDKQVFLNGINKSLILREIRQIWSQILSTYSYGMFTKEELTNLLVQWQFPQAEIDIKIQTAELVKTKTVNQLMRDADIYLYRQGTISEGGAPSPLNDGLYDRLIAQDIPADVANAITRNEACKKGIDWELPA